MTSVVSAGQRGWLFSLSVHSGDSGLGRFASGLIKWEIC